MTAQDQTPLRAAETAGPLIPKSQPAPIKAGDASMDYEVRPGSSDSLVERFLYNLRVVLSAPHT
jgi:hypothetical protein